MKSHERQLEFNRLRQLPVVGEGIFLEPYRGGTASEHSEVVRGLFGWDAGDTSPPENAPAEQRRWYRRYLDRSDELVWVIREYGDQIVGATTLEAIDLRRGQSAVVGATRIDPNVEAASAIELEAEHLVLQVAFDHLALEMVCAPIRPSNRRWFGIHRSFGFETAGWDEGEGDVRLMLDLDRARFDRRSSPTPA